MKMDIFGLMKIVIDYSGVMDWEYYEAEYPELRYTKHITDTNRIYYYISIIGDDEYRFSCYFDECREKGVITYIKIFEVEKDIEGLIDLLNDAKFN